MGVTKAKTEPSKIRVQDLTHLNYFDKLAPMLARLHDVGTERDRAGNRQLHYDQYCMLVLLYLFNPAITSLRSLQQASELPEVQKRLKCKRTSLGSLSESVTVFDPERLQEIIRELGAQLTPIGRDARLQDIPAAVTLVDGTVLSVLPHIARASLSNPPANNDGKIRWRLHTHFELDRDVPIGIHVTPNGGGASDERAVLERTVEKDRLYVMDRGYSKYALFNHIVKAGSSYVCRVPETCVTRVLETRPLSEAAVQERVLSDCVVSLGADGDAVDHTVRFLTIAAKPFQKTKDAKGPSCDGTIRIITNRLDVPADIIAILYHYRWTIEIFFRFFKQTLQCQHLLNTSQKGIAIQVYCAIIACMLIQLWTGRKPTLRTLEMLCWYFMGLATWNDVEKHLAKLKQRDEKKKAPK